MSQSLSVVWRVVSTGGIARRRAVHREAVREPESTSDPRPVRERQRPRISPVTLTGADRSAHVMRAIREYEAPIAKRNAAAVEAKLDKLADSPFVFFRGTADLFYRDLAGTDGERPLVLAYGDVHPENLAVLRAPDGTLFYGLDDYDEAHPAPFTWDLKRGVVGLDLLAREHQLAEPTRAKIASAYVRGYLDAIQHASEHGKLEGPRFTMENAPEIFMPALKKADERTRAEFLKKLVDGDGHFIESDELHREPDVVKRAQAGLRRFFGTLLERPKGTHESRIKDVALRTGAGTGSIGLERHYLLIDRSGDRQDVVLEAKQARRSVLSRYVKFPARQHALFAEAAESGVQAAWTKGDRFAGQIRLGRTLYHVRERSHHHTRIDLGALSAAQLEDYARAMGALVADVHLEGKIVARDTGATAKAIAKAILASAGAGLIDEMVAFSKEASERLIADHARFAAARRG